MSHSRSSSGAPSGAPRTLLSTVAMLVGLAAGTTQATTTMNGDEVIVEAHEVIADDLVVWGTYIRIDGIVQGDLVALGTDIVVEGLVEGDLIAAGKTIYLNGAVHDDVRIVAYATALGERASITDDYFVLAYSVEAKPGSRISGTAWIAAGQALLAGQIAETAAVRTGALELQGLVGGDVSAVVGGLESFDHSTFIVDLAIDVPDVADGLLVAGSAHIGGDLDYRAEGAANVAPGATIAGETRREPWRTGPPSLPSADEPAAPQQPWSEPLDRFLMLVLLSLALFAAVPAWMHVRSDDLRSETARALGWGIGAVVATGLTSFVLGVIGLMALVTFFSTGGSVALGLTAATFFLQSGLIAPFLVAVLYVAPALVCLAIGGEILERLGRVTEDDSRTAGMAPLLAGCVLYSVIRSVPVLGVLVGIFGALAGLGALALWLHATLWLKTPTSSTVLEEAWPP